MKQYWCWLISILLLLSGPSTGKPKLSRVTSSPSEPKKWGLYDWAKHKQMQIFEPKMGPTLYSMTKRERYATINFGCKFFQDWPREVQFAVFGYVLIVLFGNTPACFCHFWGSSMMMIHHRSVTQLLTVSVYRDIPMSKKCCICRIARIIAFVISSQSFATKYICDNSSRQLSGFWCEYKRMQIDTNKGSDG